MIFTPPSRFWPVLAWIILLVVFVPSKTFGAATITVINVDGQNEGFNDATPFTPVGGNTATTLGAARLNAFKYAANIWGEILSSSVEIKVDAAMDPLGSGILGQAGPTTVHRNFSNTPLANTWYVQALANKFSGMDLAPSISDMAATFSSDFTFYFGLDGQPPAGHYDFVSVVLHELAHGLGFLSLVNLTTGMKFFGVDDAYSQHLEQHNAIPADYPTMTDDQRIVAATSGPHLHFTGPEASSHSAILTVGKDSASGHVEMYAPRVPTPGSSVSHFNKVLKPDQLMEHSIRSGEALHDVGLAGQVLADLGWDVQMEPRITRPSLSATLASPVVNFEWTANTQPVTTWWLYIGSEQGARDIYSSGDLGTKTRLLVPRLPTDGRTLYVRLWYRIGGFWQFTDEQFTAASIPMPMVTSPVPGSTVGSVNIPLEWTANELPVTSWWLYIGSNVGARDLFNSGKLGTKTSVLLPHLPTDGRTLYVRLWYRMNGFWEFADHEYKAATPARPIMTSPAADSILKRGAVQFNWTANGQPVTIWWLYIGSTVGARDLFNSGDLGSKTMRMVPNLPTDGRRLYARLWYRIRGFWQFTDEEYIAAPTK